MEGYIKSIVWRPFMEIFICKSNDWAAKDGSLFRPYHEILFWACQMKWTCKKTASGRVNGALMMEVKKGFLKKDLLPLQFTLVFVRRITVMIHQFFFSCPHIGRQDEKINRALGNQFFIYEKLLPVVHTWFKWSQLLQNALQTWHSL